MREDEFRERFGQRLAVARRAAGMPQEVLAERAGVSRNEVSLIERGGVTCSVFIAHRLASALGVSLDLLADSKLRRVGAAYLRVAEIVRAMSPSDQERWASMLAVFAEKHPTPRRRPYRSRKK